MIGFDRVQRVSAAGEWNWTWHIRGSHLVSFDYIQDRSRISLVVTGVAGIIFQN